MDEFDWTYYINRYDDLAALNTEQLALEHYLTYGIYEGRSCCRVPPTICTNRPSIWFLCTSPHSGDYITALTHSLDGIGIIFDIVNLCNNDTVVCMDYTLCKQLVKLSCKKVAWIRNSERKWVPFLNIFDRALCCTHKAQTFISAYCADTRLFPIKTEFGDYDFTVKPTYDILIDCNLFNRRNIVEHVLRLKRETTYKMKIIGRGWERFCTPDEFELIRPDYHGVITYDNMKSTYLDARIIIDDCNIHTAEFGSINKRVVDAISCKRMVVTNNEIGNMDMFNGMLITYSSYETLLAAISKNDDSIIERLYEFVKLFDTNIFSYL
jgi:hypothetical protein